MSIKFACPHCRTSLDVKDELGGKRGKCPKCKGVVEVPRATPRAALQPAPPTMPAPPPDVPPPTPADVEAEAASFFSDKPVEAAVPVGPTSIDFNCPQCDEPLKMKIEDGGKNVPCPSCRRIIKVPLPKKIGPIDWRKPNAGVPSMARQDLPKVDGVWDNKETAAVSREALEEADALPELRTPATVGQRVAKWMAIAATVVLAVTGVFWVTALAKQEQQVSSLKSVKEWMATPAALQKVGPAGLAELHRLMGMNAQLSREPGCALEAEDELHRALKFAKEAKGLEHDLALSDLAVAWTEVGGAGDELDDDRHVGWEDRDRKDKKTPIVRMLKATLTDIKNPDLRLDALRAVSRRLIERDRAGLVQSLAVQSFNDRAGTDGLRERMEAVGIAGLELLRAGKRAEAEKAADYLKAQYEKTPPPPVAASAVALLLALGRPALAAGKDSRDPDELVVGRAEGAARLGNWAAARDEASAAPFPRLKLRARVVLATFALDSGAADTTDLDAALVLAGSLRSDERGRARAQFWRLLNVAIRAGIDDERLRPLLDSLGDSALRTRGQLALLRAKLARGNVLTAVGDAVDKDTLAFAMAHEAVARSAGASVIESWDQPYRSFGVLGVLLEKKR